MAAKVQQAKVLRIGIIQDGKIVQERLIKSGESVTVGESAKNTFVFPKTQLPKAEYPLFVCKGNRYQLCFTEQMRGKVSSSGAVVGLDKLRGDPGVPRQGNFWRLQLTEQDRGKIGIDQVTVLFQFVAPPPVQAIKPLQAMDFRPRLIEEDDPIFLGFLAIFTALAAVLLIYVWNTEPREVTSLEQIPDRFTKIALEPPPDIEDIPEPELEEDPNATPVRGEAEASGGGGEQDDPGGSQGPKTKLDEARQKEQLRQSLMDQSVLIRMMVTRGEHGRGTAEDLWSAEDGGLEDIDAALRAGATGARQAKEGDGSGTGLRSGSGTSTEDVDIGDLKGVGGGTSDIGSGPDVQVTGDVEVGTPDMDEDLVGDQATVKQVVQSKAGQLKYCYEQRLKEVPSLAGRVEVEWNVAGGRVTSVSIFANTTGDQELANCIIKKIRRWRFPPEIEGQISWPFVFKPSS